MIMMRMFYAVIDVVIPGFILLALLACCAFMVLITYATLSGVAP